MLAPHATCIDKASEQTWNLVHHILLLHFWGQSELICNTRCDNSMLMEQMSSYHHLAVWRFQFMGNCIYQENACKMTFLQTFRQNLQQAKHKPDRINEEFDNLYNIDTPYSPDYPYLLVPDQTPCQQLVTSRLCCQKLRLNNSIVLYVSRPKCDTLPFEDELDANTSGI